MHINYDFVDLEAFLAVKETGSFHLAAEKLALSQSAVTRRVQKLETALDSVLFERTTRMVKPTLAAKRLQARAEAILDDARETARAMRDESVAFAHQRSLVVTVATVPTVVSRLFPPALRALGDASPRLRLLDMAANEVSEAVVEGEADFGICSISELDQNTDFEVLFDDPMVLVMAVEHPLTKRDILSFADLDNQPLILPARKTGNRVVIDEAAARARCALSWSFETGRSATALDLVSSGVGVAILPLSAVQGIENERITWRSIDDPSLARPVGLLSRLGQSGSSEVSALKEALRKASRSA